MAKNVDVFGFDELEKEFNRVHKRYPNEADALLMAEGRAVNKRVKSLTPIKTKKLRNSWRLKKVKLYKNGTVRVVREQSAAPHAHLIEYGHEIIRGGKTWVKNKHGKGKIQLNRVQRAARGIKTLGRTEGKYILNKSMSEAQANFERSAEKLLDKITKDVQI